MRIVYDETEFDAEIARLTGLMRKRDNDPAYADAPVEDAYARISRGESAKDIIKVGRQTVDILNAMLAEHVRLGQIFTDPKKSAWKPEGKRPGFDAMLERITSGVTQGVKCWMIDRLMRQPFDLERLIREATTRKKGGNFVLSSCDKRYDMRDSLMELRNAVNYACEESARKSKKIRRKNEADRAAGRIAGGQIPFGHQRQDMTIPLERLQAERACVRDGIAALLSGQSLWYVADMWNERGVFRRSGLPWNGPHVRSVLDYARHGGLLEYTDTKTKVRTIVREFAPGYCDAIVSADEFRALRALFNSRTRGAKPQDSPYWLSGQIYCDNCGTKMAGCISGNRQYPTYRCPARGCRETGVIAHVVERFAALHALKTLADPAHAHQIAQASSALRQLESQIYTCEKALKGLGEKVEAHPDQYEILSPSISGLQKQLAKLKTDHDALRLAGAGREQMSGSLEALHAMWKRATPAERAALFRRAVPNGFYVCPVGRHTRGLRGDLAFQRFAFVRGQASERFGRQIHEQWPVTMAPPVGTQRQSDIAV